jgi:hypothetical protein
MSTTVTLPPATSKLELRTAYGPVFRDVLDTPPRDCTAEEIPVIDLSPLYSSKLEDREALAAEIRASAVNTGFFYIKNHGIDEKIIANAKKQLLEFVAPLSLVVPGSRLTSILIGFLNSRWRRR